VRSAHLSQPRRLTHAPDTAAAALVRWPYELVQALLYPGGDERLEVDIQVLGESLTDDAHLAVVQRSRCWRIASR
jgi:hypothetical protein